ncbi:MAG: hypothetical protein HGB12_15600, partial [Bacteroidetes bacterium]|nr:hypothetical protein [Bacteroidota bacterium]
TRKKTYIKRKHIKKINKNTQSPYYDESEVMSLKQVLFLGDQLEERIKNSNKDNNVDFLKYLFQFISNNKYENN